MEYPALRLVILFTTSFVRGKINKIKKAKAIELFLINRCDYDILLIIEEIRLAARSITYMSIFLIET